MRLTGVNTESLGKVRSVLVCTVCEFEGTNAWASVAEGGWCGMI